MAAILNFLGVLLLVSFIGNDDGQCTPEKITVKQSETGLKEQNKPEWKVTISNPCPCTVLELKLSCSGFQSERNIDPLVLTKSGEECLVNNGEPIHGFSTFNFSYVWDISFPLKPLSSQIGCS